MKPGWTTERLLRELIAIPSVNPAFVPENCSFAGEQCVAEFLANLSSRLGLAVEFQEVLPNRPNFMARLRPPSKVKMRVLLAPHLDTVGGPGEWDVLFRPMSKQGKIYGRGACDTKGSVAAMFEALARLARAGRRPSATEIVFLGLMDEENAQFGSRAIVRKGLRADLAIVGEPTQLRVVTAHKGDIWLRLETRGKSAHGARPELGRNAVHEMAQIVHVLETEYADQLRSRRHAVLGRPTVNVGSIGGGTQPNIVPDRCFITVDRRTLPGETTPQVHREIEALLRRHRLKASLSSARETPCIALETSATVPLVRAFLHAAGQKKGDGVDYFCDAAVLAQGGIPSVVFGPGNIAQAHTEDEWIETTSLEAATSLLERFLRSLP